MLWFVLLWKANYLPHCEVVCILKQVFFKDFLCLVSFILSSLYATSCWGAPQHMFSRMVFYLFFARNKVWTSAQIVLFFSLDQWHSWPSFSSCSQMLLSACYIPFYSKVDSFYPFSHKGLVSEMDDLPAGFFISAAVLLKLSVHWVLGHLSNQGCSSPVTEFGQMSPCSFQLLPFHVDGNIHKWCTSNLYI